MDGNLIFMYCHNYLNNGKKKIFFHYITLFYSCSFIDRYQNQIFFTWNNSEEELRNLLTLIASQDTNVHFTYKIGRCVPYLQALIDVYEGELSTTMYHNPIVQKYTLPYAIDNAKMAHSHWLCSALIRAVRYCTSVFEFDLERTAIEVTCLSNGYSIEFIDKRVHHFFKHFDAMSLRQTLDQNVYEKLRRRLFNFVNEQKLIMNRNEELVKKNQRIRLSYLHAFGSRYKFEEQLREILFTYLKKKGSSSKLEFPKLLSSVKYQYSLNALLSEQKPYHPLLIPKMMMIE